MKEATAIFLAILQATPCLAAKPAQANPKSDQVRIGLYLTKTTFDRWETVKVLRSVDGKVLTRMHGWCFDTFPTSLTYLEWLEGQRGGYSNGLGLELVVVSEKEFLSSELELTFMFDVPPSAHENSTVQRFLQNPTNELVGYAVFDQRFPDPPALAELERQRNDNAARK